jgi:hypothetical protein
MLRGAIEAPPGRRRAAALAGPPGDYRTRPERFPPRCGTVLGGYDQVCRPGIGVMHTTSSLVAIAVGAGLVAAPIGAQQPAADPSVAVRLTVSQGWYAPGAHGRVYVRLGRDGYLVVLHAQPDGHVQIAFPIDPADNAFVRADSAIEIRSRGDRDAFTVDDSSGSGTWYAAVSKQPFHFDAVSVGTHWDYREIPHVLAVRDAEGDLTTLVQRMATGRFDYDIVQYHVGLVGDPRNVVAGPGATGAPPSAPPPPPDDPDGPWWLGPWGGGPWMWPGWLLPHPTPGPGPLYNRVAPAGQVATPAGGESGAGRGAGAEDAHPESGQGSHHDHGGESSPHH